MALNSDSPVSFQWEFPLLQPLSSHGEERIEKGGGEGLGVEEQVSCLHAWTMYFKVSINFWSGTGTIRKVAWNYFPTRFCQSESSWGGDLGWGGGWNKSLHEKPCRTPFRAKSFSAREYRP